jgi:hypothetical protein
MSVRGILLGSLGLALLQLIVSDPARAARVGALGGIASAAVARFLSPAVAAIPDRRTAATVPPPASGTPATTPPPPTPGFAAPPPSSSLRPI